MTRNNFVDRHRNNYLSLPTNSTNRAPGISSKFTSILNRSNGADSFEAAIKQVN